MDEVGSGSFPNAFGYDEDVDRKDDVDFSSDFLQSKSKKPRVLLMGLRRSGKSSIQKVIFNKMSPNETLFLESTSRISRDEILTSSFIAFSIYNFPGQLDFMDQNVSDDIFSGISGSVVFVIDAQDDYTDALNNLLEVIQRVYKINQNIIFEVFIHKVDCVSDDNKFEIQKDIYQRVKEDLFELNLEFIKISYHLTSIYDHSIYEAFSKVVQKLIPQLELLENLLNVFISSCKVEKAFLFDVQSKIYIATDGSPVDIQSYELACEMIDCVVDISNLYGTKENAESSFDSNSASIIKLNNNNNNNTILYLRQVNTYLALVAIIRGDNFNKQGVIDFNFACFKEAIKDHFIEKEEEATTPN